MTHDGEPPKPPSPRRERIPLSWAAVIGFGTLGLLWPLLRLVGLESVIGSLGTALITLLATMLVWVLGAGFGEVPRPVVTLTLSGVVFGALVILTSALVGEWPDYGALLNVIASLIEVGRATGLGALAGALAAVIQSARRRRT